jgi:hypothetical protein
MSITINLTLITEIEARIAELTRNKKYSRRRLKWLVKKLNAAKYLYEMLVKQDNF